MCMVMEAGYLSVSFPSGAIYAHLGIAATDWLNEAMRLSWYEQGGASRLAQQQNIL
jgi:hypothetical protein